MDRPRPTGAGSAQPGNEGAAPRAGWTAEREMSYPEWLRMGRRIGTIGRVSAWWLGDWLRYGEGRFGSRYAAGARVTGYDAQTLMNMVYVATRFPVSRRREEISWSHHAAVAALRPDEQERWLDRAVARRLSVRRLRAELAATRGARDPTTPRLAPRPRVVTCPCCGASFSPAAAASLAGTPVPRSTRPRDRSPAGPAGGAAVGGRR
jgi:hypothetical protein